MAPRKHRLDGAGTVTRAGYIYLSVSGKRRFQHVLRMEEYLGRPLRPGENVHHVNGIRNDNRIENLELWSTSQPPGQRVEDKIAWAIEFLAGYGYEVSPTSASSEARASFEAGN